MYFRVKTKTKSGSAYREIKGILLLLVSFLLGYCLVTPHQAGVVGQSIAKILFYILGQAAFILPALVAWTGFVYVRKSLVIHARLDLVWGLILALSGSAVLSLSARITGGENYGGWMGAHLAPFFYRLFGTWIGMLILVVGFLYVSSLLLRVSLRQIGSLVWQKLADDYRQWQDARAEMKKTGAPRVRSSDERPVIKSERPAKQEAPAKPVLPKSEPKIVTPAAMQPQLPNMPAPAQKPAAAKPAAAATAAAAVTTGDKKPDGAIDTSAIEYKLPSLDLLSEDRHSGKKASENDHLAAADLLTKTLADFDIEAKVKEIIPGPVVTRYDIELAPGIKIQSVVALSDNLGLAMKSPSIRVVPIPEKSAVGVEVPNMSGCIVGLRGVLAHPDFYGSKSLLKLALGKTTDGAAYVADLTPMPHLLIAGATGSGKSVGIHSILLSILYKARPDEVKFMLIDPKRLEMPIYRGLPHLYDPRVTAERADIITQPKEAAEALKKLVRVMELRYEKFAREMVRNIDGYNEKMAATGGQKEFYIVVIIDELADLMLIATKEVEDSIQRLAQMARAVGIHLILATQRPSVDVITGVIKANFPARIAFQTTSKVDSRVILDSIGADALLGKGDMLFLPPGESRPSRLQGAFVSVKEAEQVVNFIKQQNFPLYYQDLFAKIPGVPDMSHADEDMQELFAALHLVVERKRVSQDLLKAHFGSSARATNILSLLETKGFIHKPEGTNRWTIYFDKINEYLTTMGSIGDTTGGEL